VITVACSASATSNPARLAVRSTLYAKGCAYVIPFLKTPRAVIAPIVLDDQFAARAQQFFAGNSDWRGGLCSLAPGGGIALRLMLTHVQMMTIRIPIIKRGRMRCHDSLYSYY
jgi:hypothetical protein